jgi:hypothetical protein
VAGLEGLPAVGGGDGDEDARLADLEPSDPVQDRHRLDARPSTAHLDADLAHLGFGHRGVGLVLEVLDRTPVLLVTHDAREDDDAAGGGIAHGPGDGVGRERLFDDPVEVARLH